MKQLNSKEIEKISEDIFQKAENIYNDFICNELDSNHRVTTEEWERIVEIVFEKLSASVESPFYPKDPITNEKRKRYN